MKRIEAQAALRQEIQAIVDRQLEVDYTYGRSDFYAQGVQTKIGYTTRTILVMEAAKISKVYDALEAHWHNSGLSNSEKQKPFLWRISSITGRVAKLQMVTDGGVVTWEQSIMLNNDCYLQDLVLVQLNGTVMLSQEAAQLYSCCLFETPRSLSWCESNCERYYSCYTVGIVSRALSDEHRDNKELNCADCLLLYCASGGAN